MSITALIIILLLIISVSFLAIFMWKRNLKRGKSNESNLVQSSVVEKISKKSLFENSSEIVNTVTISISKLYYLSILCFIKNNVKEIAQIKKDIRELNQKIAGFKKSLFITIRALDENELESGHYYVQVLDSVGDVCNCIDTLFRPISDHIENNHPTLPKDQAEELSMFNEKMSEYFNYSINILKNNRFDNPKDFVKLRDELINQTVLLKKNQIQFLKKEGKGTKVSIVFLDLMSETKNLALSISNIIEVQREFNKYSQS